MGNATSLTIGSLPKWDTSHAILCWPFVLDAGRLASPRVGRPFADRRQCQARASTRAAYRKLFGWPAWQAILSPRLPVEGVLGLTPLFIVGTSIAKGASGCNRRIPLALRVGVKS